ncbi:GspE/PulE family protein [Endothiovibrio diazotrophicus]
MNDPHLRPSAGGLAAEGLDPLARRLLQEGHLSSDQLRIAERERRQRGIPLARALSELELVGGDLLRRLRGEEAGLPTLALERLVADPEALARLPEALARRCRAVPVSIDGDRLRLAMVDGRDLPALDRLHAHLAGCRLELFQADEAEVEAAIERLYGYAYRVEAILAELDGAGEGAASAGAARADHRHPVVRLVDALLGEAVAAGASDLHFQPERGALRIRQRVDGVLVDLRTLHAGLWPAMAVRLKVMGGLDIADVRTPREGRFSRLIHGRAMDLRVSSLPTLHGENLVLRLLDRERGIPPLEALGLEARDLEALRRLAARPEGMVLVSGPTGSGKTTTLYALLQGLDRDALNVMTLEDPVEYPLPGIRQSTIREGAGFGFADGVRALLRQDPDVILIGEIRDAGTAAMALRATLTGHRVYATLHAASAPAVVPRLTELGLSPGLLAEHLAGVLSQRLVRRLCLHCRRRYRADGAERAWAGGAEWLWRAEGCERCAGRGYHGRVALLELLIPDEALAELLAYGAPPRELRRAAAACGYRTLAEAGRSRLRSGETSLAELARVVELAE